MCDPLTIAGIALTVGSTAANTIAANQVNAAREDVLAAERIRQRGLDQEADTINAQSQDRYKDFGTQQDAKAASLADLYTGQNVTPPSAGMLPTSMSDLVVNEQARQGEKAQAFTDQQGEGLARLRAFGDLLGGISLKQGRDAGQIGQIGGFKQGSSAVVPYELDQANRAGDGLRTFADILGGLGSIGTTAGLSGANIGKILTGKTLFEGTPLKLGIA